MLEEEVLALAQRHADQVEVYSVSSRSIPVSYEGNRLKSVDTRESSGMALRIIKDGRIGFSSTTNMEDKEGLVARAVGDAAIWRPRSPGFPRSQRVCPRAHV